MTCRLEQIRRAYNWPFILTWFVGFPLVVVIEGLAIAWAAGVFG